MELEAPLLEWNIIYSAVAVHFGDSDPVYPEMLNCLNYRGTIPRKYNAYSLSVS